MSFINKLIENKNKGENKSNRQIVHLTYFLTAVYIILITYIFVFVIKDSNEVINNSYNKREEIYAKKTVRGAILTDNGEVLAYTDTSLGSEKRVYPYGRYFAHVVGYCTKGKAGIESICNLRLLSSNINFADRISNELGEIKNPGDSIITTLDLNTQIAAYEALGNNNGAVVVMDADNGYIISMVSKPDFNPNEIDNYWNSLINDEANSSLLNRATQGLYPPGSTFKILTALEYLKENKNTDNYDFDCNGFYEYDGTKINCYHGISHGDVDFDMSFAKSCNASFANITTKLNKNEFRKTCEDLLFNRDIPSPTVINKSSSFALKNSFVPINTKSSTDELMQTGIGQGLTEITPYHMCLISAAIANNGVLMNPIIVKEIKTERGEHVSGAAVNPYKRLISEEDSDKVKMLMRKVITDGTGNKLLNTNGYLAYGKTGSAEFNSNKTQSHAWFTGFAEGENGRKIAISVIVENGGSGGQVAVPIARAVFDAYYNR